jgi:uncharacterized protein (TIGR03437 family)
VVNAASYKGGRIAPGEIVAICGKNLGPADLLGMRLDESGKVATTLGDTRVFFNDFPAPLLAVRADQVNAVVPYDVPVGDMVRVQVSVRDVLSNSVTLPVASSSPGLFTWDVSGQGAGAILNEDLRLNSRTNPAGRGAVVVLYATGEGLTEPHIGDGVLAQPPLPTPVQPVRVSIGGVESQIQYKGAAPVQVAGLMQVNVALPQGVPGGPKVPILLEVANIPSQTGVTLAIVPPLGDPTLTMVPGIPFSGQPLAIQLGISAAQPVPTTVTLTSSNSAVATVPPSAVIPADENFVFFNLTPGTTSGAVISLLRLPDSLGGAFKTLNFFFGGPTR